MKLSRCEYGLHGPKKEIMRVKQIAESTASDYFCDSYNHIAYLHGSRAKKHRHISEKAFRSNWLEVAKELGSTQVHVAREVLGLFEELDRVARAKALLSNQLIDLIDMPGFSHHREFLAAIFREGDCLAADWDISIAGRQERGVFEVIDRETGAIVEFHAENVSKFPEYFNS